MGILNRTVFDEFDLTCSQVIGFSLLCCFILGSIAYMAAKRIRERHRLAWVSSLINAIVTSFASIVYLMAKRRHRKLLNFEGDGRDVFHSIDNFSALICIWFGIANAFDLLFGLLCYREHLGVLTSYIHHVLYIWMMILFTTGHGGFTMITPSASCFTILVIEEFPILLLSLGNVFPQYDTDIGFGVSFFLLRLVYHFYCMVYAIYSGVDSLLVVLFLLTLSLHVYWFVGFMPYLFNLVLNIRKRKMP